MECRPHTRLCVVLLIESEPPWSRFPHINHVGDAMPQIEVPQQSIRQSRPQSIRNQMLCTFTVTNVEYCLLIQNFTHIHFLLFCLSAQNTMQDSAVSWWCWSSLCMLFRTSLSEVSWLWNRQCYCKQEVCALLDELSENDTVKKNQLKLSSCLCHDLIIA